MKSILFAIIAVSVISCKNDFEKPLPKFVKQKKAIAERKFPEVKNLSEFPNTEFVASLEHSISDTKNVIYAATMPYAWENIKKSLGTIFIDSNDKDLFLLNQVTSHQNTLKPNEIDLEVTIEDTYIYSRAYFRKSLPFKEKLMRFPKPLSFNGSKVDNFGFYGYPFNYETYLSDIFNILYYKDDSEFVFNLLSKDKEHELILYKSKNLKSNNLKVLIQEIETKINLGMIEKKKEANQWKYYYDAELDTVKIPVFDFNIENNYTSLEKKLFKAKNKTYRTETIYQRNAFILDEYGAEIESVAVDSAAATEIDETIPKPKRIFLDSDFIIIAKRKDSKNPYFVVLNRNSELMKKQQQNVNKK